MAKLVAKSPDLAGQVLELEGSVITFGRGDDNVLCIPHASISGHHGEFRLDGADYRLIDIGSTNGSKVNNDQTTDRLLSNGDLVMLGNMLFAYEADAPVTAAAVPLPTSSERIALGLNQSGSGRPSSFVNLSAIAKPSKSKGAKLPLMVIVGVVVALAGAAYLAYTTFGN
jgi:hypothetical protein